MLPVSITLLVFALYHTSLARPVHNPFGPPEHSSISFKTHISPSITGEPPTPSPHDHPVFQQHEAVTPSPALHNQYDNKVGDKNVDEEPSTSTQTVTQSVIQVSPEHRAVVGKRSWGWHSGWTRPQAQHPQQRTHTSVGKDKNGDSIFYIYEG
jgi:hypothetical protein